MAYIFRIAVVHHTHFTQTLFTFLGFFGKDVAFKRMLPLDLTGSGKTKPLFSTGFGLHFRHSLCPLSD